MTLEQSEDSELESALPLRPQKRDALGQLCFVLHFLPLIYVVTGWLAQRAGFSTAYAAAALLATLSLPFFLVTEKRLLRPLAAGARPRPGP